MRKLQQVPSLKARKKMAMQSESKHMTTLQLTLQTKKLMKARWKTKMLRKV